MSEGKNGPAVNPNAPTVVTPPPQAPVPADGGGAPVLPGVVAEAPAVPPAPAPVFEGAPTPVSPPTAPVMESAAPATTADKLAPAAKAAAQKAAVIAGKGKDEAKRLWGEFQEQSKFLRWKVYVAASYAVVVILTLFIAWPRNAIDAKIQITRHPLSGEPIVYVLNESQDEWQNVVVRVNDVWMVSASAVSPGGDLNNVVSKFVKQDKSGKVVHAPRNLEPRKVEVETSAGEFVWEAQ
jgi:hypothetical protein